MLSLSPCESLPPNPTDVAFVIEIGHIASLGPQWLYSVCAPHIGAARAAIAGATELPTMFVGSWFVLRRNSTGATRP